MTTKRELVKQVAEQAALSQSQAAEVVGLFLDRLSDELLAQGRVELRNFGVFELKARRPRKARDPRTGETMEVPARTVVNFRAGQALRERVAARPSELT